MREITIRDEFIRLGQSLKLSGIASTGVEAKYMIEDGLVTVNDNAENRRGRKLYPGDIVKVSTDSGRDEFVVKSL